VLWIQWLWTYWQHLIFFVSYDCPYKLHCLSLASHSILSVMKDSSLLGQFVTYEKNEVSWIWSLGLIDSTPFSSWVNNRPNKLHCLSLASHSILSVMKHSSLLDPFVSYEKMKCHENSHWELIDSTPFFSWLNNQPYKLHCLYLASHYILSVIEHSSLLGPS
jgi:hypothetical protein